MNTAGFDSKLEMQILPFNDFRVTLSPEPPFSMSKVLIQTVYFQAQIKQPSFLFLSSAWISACGCQNIRLELIGTEQLKSVWMR